MLTNFGRRFSSSTFQSNLASKLKNKDLLKTKGYINGKWVESCSKEKISVTDPAVGDSEVIAQVSSMTTDDYNTAIKYAKDSFMSFRDTTGKYRGNLLRNLYELMQENKEDLAKLIVFENGKPYDDAMGEIEYASSFFEWFAAEAPRIYGDTIGSGIPSQQIITFREPVGVCGILTPWNFPSAMITRKLGAAVAAGCTTVIKPASETPLSALALAHLSEQAGFANGIINVLPSFHAADVGRVICEHPDIKKVSFTGSTSVGKILMSQSGSTLKKLSMELGGNAPFIVFDDCNIDEAVSGAIASKFRSSGQTCICTNRLFIHESIYEEFTEKLTSRLKKTIKLGNGINQETTHGPLIHQKALSKVKSQVSDAVSKGAYIALGGSARPDLGPNFHDLTVLTNVTPEMDIFHEETFGPIAPLIKFKSEDEVIESANNTNVGLAGYFYSNNIRRVFDVAKKLNVGMVGVNTGAISEAALPFGGVNESGFGREGSKYGIEDYLVTKSVVLGGLGMK